MFGPSGVGIVLGGRQPLPECRLDMPRLFSFYNFYDFYFTILLDV